jgi:hypothetical protein
MKMELEIFHNNRPVDVEKQSGCFREQVEKKESRGAESVSALDDGIKSLDR